VGDSTSAHARDLVRAAQAHVDRLGAFALSTIVSERSADALRLFHSAGFRQARVRKPLFVCSAPEGERLPAPFTELNHFAADLAHRF
jgi:hypothetical protein